MYQRDVIDKAFDLHRQGFTDQAVAEICGASVGAVRKWRYGTRRRIPDPAAPGAHDGRIKQDCPRCFGRTLDSAEYSYLAGLYLGDGHIVATTKGCYRLTISCTAAWPGLVEAAATAMSTAMPLSKVSRRQRSGAVEVHSQSKHWPCLFPQHGPGLKHAREIRLADWQRTIVDEHPEKFLRGLLHSDGCRTVNRVRRPGKDGDRVYEYPRYFFTNASDDIRKLYTDTLDALGIAWKQNNARNISVARAEAVARLDEFVGPKY
ncbi:hypothetical protein AB0J52_14075 [Spirillospora sp. NPDC049652]